MLLKVNIFANKSIACICTRIPVPCQINAVLNIYWIDNTIAMQLIVYWKVNTLHS